MNEMGIKRIVDTSFWTDGKVDDFSPEDKYFMLYLLTNPFSTQLGIYEISIKQVAFQMGYSVDAVKVLIDRFENKYGMIHFSPETNEIAIKNFLRHSIIKGGKPVEDCIKKEMSKVKDRALLDMVFSHIADKDDLNETVKKIIIEYEKQNENDNDNDNDNDNENEESSPCRERFVDESQYEQIKADILDGKGDGSKVCEWCGCKTSILHKHHYPVPKRLGGKKTVDICSNCHSEFHSKEREILGGSYVEMDSPKPPQKPKKPKKETEPKHKHGEHQKVLLTDSEFERLADDYGENLRDEAIIFLDAYIAEKGYKSQSHNLAIRRWVIDAVKERMGRKAQTIKQPIPQKQTKADELNNAYDMMAAWAGKGE